VATSVVRIALAADETVGLERIEQRHQDAWIDPRRPHQLALSEAAVVMQEPEDLELPRLEPMCSVSGPQPAHRFAAEERQE
jgi:hypothetical protein